MAAVAAVLLFLLSCFQRQMTEEGYRQRTAWLTVRDRLKTWDDTVSADLPVALALGLALGPKADPTFLVTHNLAWTTDTFVMLDAAGYSATSGGDSGGGGGGAGDGGGGGGAE